MTRVEVIKENCRIVMIDGFVPLYEYLMANRNSLEKKGPLVYEVLHRYSSTSQISENRLLLLFEALLRTYRLNHCQDNCHFYDNNRPFECNEFMLTTKQNWHSIENTVCRTLFTKYLPILEKEYRNHESKGYQNYAQNILIYDPTCEFNKKCAFGWIRYFNFYTKKKNEYLNFSLFKRTWENILLE